MIVDTLTEISTDVNMNWMRLVQTIEPECCPQVMAAPLDEEAADRLAAALKVIADPARLRLLSIIGADPRGEVCVCNLTEPMGLSQPTVSHHLKVLTGAGLLEREQRGRWAFFRVRRDTLEMLRGALAPVTGAPSEEASLVSS
jgi:ArsR family transcriptional regulator